MTARLTRKEHTMSSTPATARSPRLPRREVTPDLERRLGRLRFWNVGVGLVLAVEAVAIALLTNGFTLPVTATYMTGPPGTPPELTTLFDVPLGWGVFAFVAISALALFTIASPGRLRAGTSATCCRTATTGAGSSTSSAPAS